MKQSAFFTRFLILFYILVFLVPGFLLMRGNKPIRSLIEYRSLDSYPVLTTEGVKTALKRISRGRLIQAWYGLGGKFRTGEYQSAFEKAVSDRFPFRSASIQMAFGLDRILIRLAYLQKTDKYLPADLSYSQIDMTRDGSTLFYVPKEFRERERDEIDRTIETYDSLIDAHPQTNFYAFYLDVIDHSAANPLSRYTFNADAGQSIAYFEENLPSGLIIDKLILKNFEDYRRLFYRSDHHWNIYGTLRGYEIIYRMLSENYPEISPMLNHDEILTFQDIDFQGSMARRSLFHVRPPDRFEVAVLDLPPYRILDKEGNDMDLNNMAEYLTGKYSKAPFTDHYIEYYGADTDYIEYVFENGAERNLLIIGDSYMNSIELMLAAHYHHTYCVDIRYYPDATFSLSTFMAEHEVDDILFMGPPDQVIHQANWTITP